MSKKILAVGIELPGSEVEEISLLSDRSLLDADIVLFKPEIPYVYGSETYLGKTCLSDDGSFRVKEAIAHWHRELAAAYDAGKFVVVFLETPETVYAATGKKEWSGTGRNARATRIVDLLHAYSVLPTEWKYHAATGTEMTVETQARFFSSYWSEFSQFSQYRLFLTADGAQPLVRTKSGSRVVGAYMRKGRGAFLAIPLLDLDQEGFIETRKVEGKDQVLWTKAAISFTKRLVASIVNMSDAFVAEHAISPPPDWASSDIYALPAEKKIQTEILAVTTKLTELDAEKRRLEDGLAEAGAIRGLLFEQGSSLEEVVRLALKILGFSATNLKENDSEFDVVFQSAEGRFIGEVEGKDNKPINIDKFSQLERNLHEDFAREEVSEYAKGVLFGNAYRLQPIEDRRNAFTEKCVKAAQRLGAALISTSDLFEPCRYLSLREDALYAASCRQAILTTSGAQVCFPKPPDLDESVENKRP